MQSRSGSSPQTRIVTLTGEVGLLRLLRSILESQRLQSGPGALALEGASSAQPVDIVIADLKVSTAKVLILTSYHDETALSGAQTLAITREYREADCIAILDLDVDYLPLLFRAQDLTGRVRVARLRRFKAAGHKRFYRHGSLVIDLFDRTVVLGDGLIGLAPSALNLLLHLASKPGTGGDIRRYPGGGWTRQLGEQSPGSTNVGLSTAPQARA